MVAGSSERIRLTWGALAAAGLLSILASGCGVSSSDEVNEGVAKAELGRGAVAVVSQVTPEIGVIRDGDFERALAIVAATGNLESLPAEGSRKYRELKETALAELLDAAWIEGQAEEMGIEVTPAEAADELRRIKRESFKEEADYQSFLRESRMTEDDVEARTRLQLLSSRVQERISGGQEEFADFVSRYEERWRSRTTCAPGYRTERCSNGPPP